MTTWVPLCPLNCVRLDEKNEWMGAKQTVIVVISIQLLYIY